MRRIITFCVVIVYWQLASASVTAKAAVAPNGVPVVVTATAGVTGPATYGTLGGPGGAFTAINASTHQGAVTIEVLSPGTVETGSAILNGSGAGGASHTSVLISPGK